MCLEVWIMYISEEKLILYQFEYKVLMQLIQFLSMGNYSPDYNIMLQYAVIRFLIVNIVFVVPELFL